MLDRDLSVPIYVHAVRLILEIADGILKTIKKIVPTHKKNCMKNTEIKILTSKIQSSKDFDEKCQKHSFAVKSKNYGIRPWLQNGSDENFCIETITKVYGLSSSTMTSSFFAIVFLLFFSSCSVADGSIRVRVETDFGVSAASLEKGSVLSYSVVNERNETLFAGGDLAVFVSGVWCVAPSQFSALQSSSPSQGNRLASQPLLPASQEAVNGRIPGLGNYEGVRILWHCDLTKDSRRQRHHGNNSNNNFQVITSFLNFESNRAVLFDIEYPMGAENTSLVVFNQTDGDLATLATFPSFVMNSEADSVEMHEEGRSSDNPKSSRTDSYFPPTFPSALSWEGTFIQGVRRLSVGPRGGPTVLFNSSDPTLANVVAASPFFDLKLSQNFSSSRHHFNQFTAGNNLDWTGNIPSFSLGRSGRLTSVPPGSSQSILMYQGSKGGITSTVREWGRIMQTASQAGITTDLSTTVEASFKNSQERKSLKRPKLDDLTLEQIGYQTDNGAMYCFCDQSNCSEVLLEEKEYLDSIGIPIGYLSFQGAGTSSGRGKAAPWCVEKWSADDGQDRNKYPIDTKDFQKALGIPLQLYAPYFCPNTTGYFQPDTPWNSLSSNPQLPGCSHYNFETAGASDSKAFFEWFLNKGIENAGMVSFESDFMNQNANCVDEFVENPTHGFDEFLQGMADAALGLGVPIQWCMASPNLVMASLNYPAVTNFRVSFDYCYGGSYDIGESSLLVWAVGASPSKDTLWTTDNNRTETPGCDWTVDHEAVAAELHVVLALMSTGYVRMRTEY